MMGHGAVYLSADGYIFASNPAAEFFLGLPSHALHGRKITDPFWQWVRQDASPFEIEQHPALIALTTGERVSNQLMGIRIQNNEAITWVRVSAFFEDATGHQSPPHLCLIFEDASDQKDLEHKLKERVKELNAFYSLTALIELEHITLEVLYQRLAEILPKSWQHDHAACARITIHGREFTSDHFEVTQWGQTAPVKVHGQIAGALEIYYRSQFPAEDEGPFLKEERMLLNSMAERIGRVTERESAALELQKKNDFVELALRASNLGTWQQDFVTDTVFLDEIARGHFGFETASVTERDLIERIHPEDQRGFVEKYQTAIQNGDVETITLKVRALHPNGVVNWLSLQAQLKFAKTDAGLIPLSSVGTTQDITEQKRDEEMLARKTRALYVLSNCNQALVRIFDENELLHELCRICVQDGGYRMAWVGFVEHGPGKAIRPVAQYGFEEEYLESANITWEDSERGRGPTGIAVRTGQPSIAQNINSDPRLEPWRAAATQRGYASSIALPLNLNGQVIGAFMLYSPDPGAFESEEVKLLVELSLDMAYGIQTLRARTLQACLQKELERSETRYKLAQRSALIGSWEWVIDSSTVYWSEEMYALLGKKPGEFIPTSSTFLEYICPEDRADVRKMIQEAFASKSSFAFEFRTSDENGNQKWLSSKGSVISGSDGEPSIASGTVQDVTELKTAHLELEELNRSLEKLVEERTADLRQREMMYRALFENSNDGIFLIMPDGSELMPNQHALDMLGYTMDEYMELSRNSWNAVAAPEQQEDGRERFYAVLRGEHIPLYERTLLTKDGRRINVEINLSAVRDAEGNITMVQSVVRDITDRKKAEKSMQESRDRLAEVNVAMEKASRLKDEFLASMSHELRTPLTGILGLSEAMQIGTYGNLSEKQRNSLRLIEQSGRHLLELINDILDLSKIEAEKLDMLFEMSSIAEICQASLHIVKGMAGQKKQNISFTIDPPSIVMQTDARRLKQMLVNLLSNAVKFTPERHNLGLEVQGMEDEGLIRFTVWDEGIGIMPEDLEKLFKPFVQLDSKLSRQYSGTGLGLSLVRRMAEMHGGSVHVESVPEKGSRFSILLPWKRTDLPSGKPEIKDSNSGKVKELASAPQPIGGPLILVGDDNKIILDTLSDFLLARGYRVEIVQSGFELLDRIPLISPDLILVDIQMPGMDGLEVIHRIRAHNDKDIASIPIIAVTALAMSGDRERCLQAGANDYLSKPVSLQLLSKRVTSWLPKKKLTNIPPSSI